MKHSEESESGVASSFLPLKKKKKALIYKTEITRAGVPNFLLISGYLIKISSS